MASEYFLAIDIGTNEGCHVVGWRDGDKIRTEVVYTFRDFMIRRGDRITWNISSLKDGLICGIRKAFEKFPYIVSLSIDAWGFDYVLTDGDVVIHPCYSHLYDRTGTAVDEVHKRIRFGNMYMSTGVQFRRFNSVYQLYDDMQGGRLRPDMDFMMIPEYLTYVLTGKKVHEYTVSTTTGLVNVRDKDFDGYTVACLGFKGRQFRTPVAPGTLIGRMTPEIEHAVGRNCDVVMCASHNVASAVYGLDDTDNNPYLLLGDLAWLGNTRKWGNANFSSMYAGFSNIGGADGILYTKNMMGLWVLTELIKNYPSLNIKKVEKIVTSSVYTNTIDLDNPVLLRTRNMKSAFDYILKDDPPRSVADYFRCVYVSLAKSVGAALTSLVTTSSSLKSRLNVAGPGANLGILCRFISDACDIEVVPVTVNVAALGNLKMQMHRHYGRYIKLE